MGKRWKVLEQDSRKINRLASSYNLHPLLARCILNRNLEKSRDIEPFLQPSSYTPPDPFLMPDMARAVARIRQAIANSERICIYGDYDADGVTAISILSQGLREMGADVFYYIPDRFFEGVGLHTERLKRLHRDEGVGLVISVDTGIRAFEEIQAAAQWGMDVIVTDHHTPEDRKPNAAAVLNPKLPDSHYPFKELSGSGVAFKLVQALQQSHDQPLNLDLYLQIAAVGTIADMVPLLEENRWIVAEGLARMNRDPQGPFRPLLRRLGIRGEANALDISFKIAPRINAPGRLGDPDVAIAFFEARGRELNNIIEIMDGMNAVRQNVEREQEAKMEFQLKHAIRKQVPPFILVAGRFWHRGILGIMACKLLRRFSRPACVLSFDESTAYGSIRSIPGVDILEPLDQIASLLTSYGGHPEAAGITLPLTNVPQFKARMAELLEPLIARKSDETARYIDAEINWRDLSPELFDKLSQMAPFGIGNAMPVFTSANLILESELLRRGPWYLFEVSDGSVSRKCSFYHPIELNDDFERFDSVDLVYSLAPFRDEYQVQIVEMRPSRN